MELLPQEPTVDFDPFAAGPLSVWAPTTEAQQEILASAFAGGDASAAFNQTLRISLAGALDIGALREALDGLVARHDALRLSFAPDAMTFVVADRVLFELEELDLSGMTPTAAEDKLAGLATSEVTRPFDLLQGPLLRARVCRLSAELHCVFLTVHHSICDGWSSGTLLSDFAELYSAAVEHRAPNLEPAPSFAQYALERSAERRGASYEAALRYWTQRYTVLPPVLDLPNDRPRPALRTYSGDRVDRDVGTEVIAQLRRVGARNGATLLATLCASFQAFIARLTGVQDLVVGISSAGQAVHGVPGLIGHCVNMLPLRAAVRPDQSFGEVVKTVNRELLDAQENQSCTFGTLLAHLEFRRDPSRVPLVPVIFNLDRATAEPRFSGLRMEAESVARGQETFEWFVNVVEMRDRYRFEWSYNTDLFSRGAIERFFDNYVAFLSELAADADRSISIVPLLSQAERARIAQWNATAVEYPPHETLHGLIEEQVRRTPDATAVSFHDTHLSYRDLNDRANQLAHWLRDAGAGLETPIGVFMERSLEMVVSLLGILKAGSAYVPLDPEYPAARLEAMLEDARVPLILTQAHIRDQLPATASARVTCVDTEWDAIATHASSDVAAGATRSTAAYIIFTSGSTGRPKGVVNTHAGICNRLLWMQQAFGIDPSDAVLQKTPFSFDVSVWEFFWPLMTGARLVMAEPGSHRDPFYLVSAIAGAGITTIHFVPSVLQAFLDADVEQCTTLKRIICSGEALPSSLAEEARDRMPWAELHNLYGPTEAAVDVTWWPCDGSEIASVPIGRPIANTRIHILDVYGNETPIGVPGELNIGGIQVARGYINRPELTAERFVADPFAADSAARLYRTGDLAYWRDDGAIEFLGRLDHQVKIRGLRIELGEIEAALEAMTEVRQAVVMARGEADDRRLVAYVVFGDGHDMLTSEIRQRLGELLPQYMVPGIVVPLESFPLSPNGKVDRRQLPDPMLSTAAPQREAEPPQGAAEELVASVWTKLLKTGQVDRHDNFFELGGHSLLAVQAVTQIAGETGVRLNPRDFAFRSLAQLTALVDAAAATGEDDGSAADRETAGTSTGLTGLMSRIGRSLYRK